MACPAASGAHRGGRVRTVALAEVPALLPASGRVFVHGAAATPAALLEAIVAQASRYRNLEFMHLHTMGPAAYCEPRFAGSFRVCNFFVGANVRPWLDYDRVDYLPCFLSAIPGLLRGPRRPDVALVQVSPPDAAGRCSLGTSVDVARTAVREAGLVIAQVNPQVPYTFGAGELSVADIDYAVEVDQPLAETAPERLGEREIRIGQQVASLVEDGSTLQVGIGSIPNAVLRALAGHRNLGVHTEMFSDGLLPLLASGAVNNRCKTLQPGRITTSFVSGTSALFDFVGRNPEVVFLGSETVNDPSVIARQPRMVAINSAIEVDLSGQVCADSIGPKVISGFGGQLDFIRGAAGSVGGKAIIALPARTKHGISRIVPRLQNGAGVVTTRGDVDYIVTEFGIAHLKGLTSGERRRALIDIAHPDDREALARQAHDGKFA